MAYTQSDLDGIRAAIARGEKTVQFADRSVTYRSVDEMLVAERKIAAELNPPASKTFYVAPTQGF